MFTPRTVNDLPPNAATTPGRDRETRTGGHHSGIGPRRQQIPHDPLMHGSATAA